MALRCVEPFLRWAGSKRRLIPLLRPYWQREEYNRYVEPFAGSACLFFALSPTVAVLGDTNASVTSALHVVKRQPRALFHEIARLPSGKSAYYTIRDMSNSKDSKLMKAARFIYLNRYCFNGLYRTNMQGKFNVPYSGARTGPLPSEEHLVTCSGILKSAVIATADFEVTLDATREGDFVYLDPPYFVRGRRIFRQYGKSVFAEDDLLRLVRALERLDARGVAFLVSYAYSKQAKALFGAWKARRILTQRNIAGFHHFRRKSYEMLVSNRF